jgi:excisionase family DNA binding protein
MMGTGTSLPAGDAGTRYYTVAQAARELQVHRTTITRWIKTGRLRAFRVGPKVVRITATDLEQVIAPASESGEGVTAMKERHTAEYAAVSDLPVKPLTGEEKERALATIARLSELREKLRREVGTFPPSEDIIREEREKRSKQLADL